MLKSRSITSALLLTVFALVPMADNASAQWVTDGAAVCTELLDQYRVCIAPDGSGGGIMAWVDLRGGTYNIYSQRIDSGGYTQWTTGGLLVCASTGMVADPLIVSDGEGGAYIVWNDQRNGNWDIYAQRLDSNGTPLWTANGLGVCTQAADQTGPSISSDNMGGVSIAWMDYRNMEYDIYMQNLDPDGDKAWAADGIIVCNTTGNQQYPAITWSGLAGGSIIVWEDMRGADRDIYAQYISSVGMRQWGLDGLAISTAADEQWSVQIAPDGSNGAFMVWISGQMGVYTTYEVHAQRVDLYGTALWTAGGMLVCDDPGRMRDPQVMADGDGGAIICWDSPGRLPEPWAWQWGVFASKISGAGVPQWGADGIPVYQHGSNGSAFYLNNSQLVTDGFGGAVITWDAGYIQAQRVDAGGALIWGPEGRYACEASGSNENPQLVPDGAKGAIIAWQDGRTPANGLDIYAQRVMTYECFVSTDTLDFGEVPVGQTKLAGFLIRNTGGVTLTGSVSLSCPQFTLDSTDPPDDPFVLEEGEQMWVYVNFEPAVPGTFFCTVETGDSVCFDVECVGVGSECPTGLIYVDADATGSDDGTSWADAFTDLQDAFALVDFCGTIDEIWVAEGVYTPTAGTDRSATFSLRNGLEVYGGFDGTETMLEERDVESNPTVLSGDLGGVNSYHVVTAGATIVFTAVLDGFTITGGIADGAADEDQRGGGLYNLGYPIVRNCAFIDNSAAFGGGVYCEGQMLRLYGVSFLDNTAISLGGGMYCSGQNQYLRDVVFRGNSASSGGGMYNQSTDATAGSIVNVVFEDNDGSAMYNNSSSPAITNAIFYGNHAGVGAGMRNVNGSSPALVNVSFGNNVATTSAGGMSNGKSSNPTVTNTIFWGNQAPATPQIGNIMISVPVISYSIIEGCGGSGGGWDAALGTDGGGNLDVDPRWKTGYSSDPPLMLWSSSPAINTGSNAAVPGGVTTDPSGAPRFYDVTVDRGAYEYQGSPTDAGEDVPQVPDAFALYQNAPNPFNPLTTIRFDLPHPEHVRLTVYNIKGESVAVLADRRMNAGRWEITWNAQDDSGHAAASGVYFYRLAAGEFVQTKKMILLR